MGVRTPMAGPPHRCKPFPSLFICSNGGFHGSTELPPGNTSTTCRIPSGGYHSLLGRDARPLQTPLTVANPFFLSFFVSPVATPPHRCNPRREFGRPVKGAPAPSVPPFSGCAPRTSDASATHHRGQARPPRLFVAWWSCLPAVVRSGDVGGAGRAPRKGWHRGRGGACARSERAVAVSPGGNAVDL